MKTTLPVRHLIAARWLATALGLAACGAVMAATPGELATVLSTSSPSAAARAQIGSVRIAVAAPVKTSAVAAAPTKPSTTTASKVVAVAAPIASTPATHPNGQVAVLNAAGDPTTPTALVGSAANMTGLTYVSPNPAVTTTGVGPVPNCARGYKPPASLVQTSPVALPASGGIFYNATELSTWKQRVGPGPFVKAGDYVPGSPGDWVRITNNANLMATTGEQPLTPTTPSSTYATQGTLARDAAFYQLITGDGTMLAPVRSFLLAQVSNSAADFPTTLCITSTSGTTYDAWYDQASWLLRYMATYDFVRTWLSSADRLTVENFIRRNAYFLAANNDWGLAGVFPNRLVGSYATKAGPAAATTSAAIWVTKQYDTNGDCTVNSADNPTFFPVYAYVNANGTLGPRLSVLSQYYNNRRSTAALTFGTAGLMLADPNLITSSKRYFMEWLTYGVWPDGSQGDYFRNGDYCVQQQGPIYATYNTQGATTLARLLARQGDNTMPKFSTTDGLFGTQGSTAKTISTAVATHYKLFTGQLPWYYYEGWKANQVPRSSTMLGTNQVYYMGSTTPMDDFHELGFLGASAQITNVPVSGWVMRDPTVVSLPFPGASGHAVTTGYGTWTDGFNALPAVFLLRP